MSGPPQSLEARARAGDAAAQFEFAVTLDRAGRRAEATSWMEAAARGDHVEALAILAVSDLQGMERQRDPASALARLTRAVSLGGNSARRLLAVLTAIGAAGEASWAKAVALVLDAAKADDFQAYRELALLVEMAVPGSPLSDDLLLRAGLKGDGLAGFAILRRHALQGRTLAPERVFAQWRDGIARIGHPLAERIAAVVAPPDTPLTLPDGEPDWNRVAEVLREPPGVNVRPPTSVSEKPIIRAYDELMTVEECEYVVGLSTRILVRAEVLDRTTGQPLQSQVRTNSVAVFWPVHQDLVVHALNLRLAAATGLPWENGELLNVLMYNPGEEYRVHYDFFPVETAKADPSGQRIRTLLVSLDTDFDGGETHFVTAGMKMKGAVGDGLLFHNCDAAGAPDKSSLHAGLPVTRGRKWLISKWFREKRFAG